MTRQIEATALWTGRRLDDGSADGDALGNAAGDDPRPALLELSYQQPIETAEGDIHRKFQLRLDGHRRRGGSGGAYSGGEQDVDVSVTVQIGYHVTGVNGYGGDWLQAAEVAAQDAEAVRQELEHPDHRLEQQGSGVTAGRTSLVSWMGTRYRTDLERGRLLSETEYSVALRVTTEAA